MLNKLLPTLVPILGALVAAATLVTSAPAQEIKLTLADQNSPTAWGPTHALQPWVKQIEEATKGRVKIEVFPSQTLVKGPDMWRQVRAGVVDIGWCFHGYWADQTPLADVISLPFLPIKTSEQASAVLWQLYQKFPAIQKEFSDVVPLLLYTTSPYFMLTTKKQVKTIEDLKGLKIRIPGGPPTEMIKALGAVPAPIPMPDMYQALDKGVVDGMGVAVGGDAGLPAVRGREVLHDGVDRHSVLLALRQQAEVGEPAERRAQAAIMGVSGEKARGSGARISSTPPKPTHSPRSRPATTRWSVTKCRRRKWRAGTRPRVSRSGKSG